MPDRVTGAAALVYVDAPRFSGAVTATIIDATGATALNAASATKVGTARYPVTIPASAMTRQGVWVGTWTPASGEPIRQEFTVGPRQPGLTRWELRLQIAGRLGGVIESTIDTSQPGVVIDPSLLGSPASYRGWWLLLHPEAGTALAGLARRVVDFAGSAMTLSSPFPLEPAAGTRYALMKLDPREVDRAVVEAAKEMSGASRIPLAVSGLALVAGSVEGTKALTLPQGFLGVTSLYTAKGEEVPYDWWTTRPGRQLVLTQDGGSADLETGDLVTVAGIRALYAPVWEDSVIEIEPTALKARAAVELLAARAGGAGVDAHEHLRRQLMAQQEYEGARRYAAGRMPAGIRPVID